MKILLFLCKKLQVNHWVRVISKFFLSSICTLFPIKENKVLMDNFHGKGYGGNPKYIAEEMLQRKGFDIVWLTNNSAEVFPQGIRPIKRHSIRAFYESATAKAWVFNERYGKLTKKRRNQVYLQTWHGSVAIKKVEKDAIARLDSRYVKKAKEDGRVADGMLVDGISNYQLFQRSFWLSQKCELLKFGTPRTDFLFREKENKELKFKIRAKLGIVRDSFFVLYAPTFRDNGSVEHYISDFTQMRKSFESKYGETMIAVRLHPNVQQTPFYTEILDSQKIIDVSMFPDVDELVLAADCLITDYSSIAYDFAIIEKPVFLYTVDLNQYIEDRGVYDVIYEQPFRLNTSMEMLTEEISTRKEKDYKDQIAVFYTKYPHYNEGKAARQAVDWLENKGMKPVNKRK